MQATPDTETPTQLGEWKIERKLGEGGMGSVYLGRSENSGLLAAIKVLPKSLAMLNARYRERFFREASIASRMQHPNMIEVRDSGEDEQYYYLVMDYVEGKTCREIVEESGAMPWKDAFEIAMRVATGLEYALAHHVIHRDVNPGNILIDEDSTPRIADMGLAKEEATELAGLTRTGASFGTPYYMSPEQIQSSRDVDFRADIYSLGATLYHLVCGTVPYTGSTFEVMTKQVSQPLPDPHDIVPDLPNCVCDIMRKMMAKDRNDRYASYEDLRDDLQNAVRGRRVLAQGFQDHSLMAARVAGNDARTVSEIMARAASKTLIIDTPQKPKRRFTTRERFLALAVLAAIVILTWLVAKR